MALLLYLPVFILKCHLTLDVIFLGFIIEKFCKFLVLVVFDQSKFCQLPVKW